MLIIDLTYKKELEDVNQLLQKHRDFLDKYYAEKVFLASGPKKPRDGGIILSLGAKEIVADIIKEDPFYQQGVADYKIIEFEPTKYSSDFEKLLGE